MDKLQALTGMSNRYGSNKAYVLGGGGNTSVKNGDIMYVKASGFSLADITPDGFAAMSLPLLKRMLKKSYPAQDDLREELALADMMAARVPGETKRPSVEALLHALLPGKYVLHLHPAAINGLTCSRQGQSRAQALFPHCIFIPLTKPGYILASVCRDEIDKYRAQTGREPEVLLLQNHGVFISADNVEEIDRIFGEVYEKTEKQLTGMPDTDVRAARGGLEKELAGLYGGECSVFFHKMPALNQFTRSREGFEPLNSAYTPDHIVYCKARPLYLGTQSEPAAEFMRFKTEQGYAPKIAVTPEGFYAMGASVKEASLAALLFADQVKLVLYSYAFGGPLPLPEEFVKFIENWEIESYRSKVSLNK